MGNIRRQYGDKFADEFLASKVAEEKQAKQRRDDSIGGPIERPFRVPEQPPEQPFRVDRERSDNTTSTGQRVPGSIPLPRRGERSGETELSAAEKLRKSIEDLRNNLGTPSEDERRKAELEKKLYTLSGPRPQ